MNFNFILMFNYNIMVNNRYSKKTKRRKYIKSRAKSTNKKRKMSYNKNRKGGGEPKLCEEIKIINKLIDFQNNPDCNKNVKNVVISDSITLIPEYAFSSYKNLTSVEIPWNVSKINGAFKDFSALKTVKFKSKFTFFSERPIKEIGEKAFYGCSSLTEIKIPKSVTEIGEEAFYGCSSLTEINIPKSVIKIGARAFFGCSELKKVNLPGTIQTISSLAFGNCCSLLTFSLENNDYDDIVYPKDLFREDPSKTTYKNLGQFYQSNPKCETFFGDNYYNFIRENGLPIDIY